MRRFSIRRWLAGMLAGAIAALISIAFVVASQAVTLHSWNRVANSFTPLGERLISMTHVLHWRLAVPAPVGGVGALLLLGALLGLVFCLLAEQVRATASLAFWGVVWGLLGAIGL